MALFRRIGAGLAALVLLAVIIWASSQSARGFVAGFIWDRDSTLECTGGLYGNRITLEGETLSSTAEPLFFASGGCVLRLVDIEAHAPTVIRAAGTAEVIVEGGRLRGEHAAIEASGRAVVRLVGTEIDGEIEVRDDAVVEGAPAR
jgi:hypothetical protein